MALLVVAKRDVKPARDVRRVAELLLGVALAVVVVTQAVTSFVEVSSHRHAPDSATNSRGLVVAIVALLVGASQPFVHVA